MTADLDRLADLQRIVAGAGLDPADQQRGLDEGRYESLLDRYREEAMVKFPVVVGRTDARSTMPFLPPRSILLTLSPPAEQNDARPRAEVPIRDREADRTIRS